MKRWKKIGSALLFIAVAVGITVILNRIFITNARNYNTTDTKEAEGSQLLFFGTSQGVSGINPLTVWDTCGIPAYNFSGIGQYIGITAYELEDVLKRHQPKVVVLDYESILRPDDFLSMSNRLYNLPMISDLRLRYQMYRDVIEESPVYLVPFFRYHNRWKELGRQDAVSGKTLLGSVPAFTVQDKDEIKPAKKAEGELVPGERELAYLEKIRRLVEEQKDCTLVLVDVPGQNTEEQLKRNNWVKLWAKEHQIPLCAGNEAEVWEEAGLISSDFADEWHMNLSGQEKFSAWLGRWLQQRCGLADLRDTAEGDAWEAKLTLARQMSSEFHVMFTQDIEEVVREIPGSNYAAVVVLAGDYDDTAWLWPGLEACGLTREQYERGGTFVRTPEGEWIFDSMGSCSFRWGMAMGMDDLYLRGNGVTGGNGAMVPQTEILYNGDVSAAVSEESWLFLYSMNQKFPIKTQSLIQKNS